jgi:hypothetical protein
MTQEMCYDLVRAAGYRYGAVQHHYHCFGGNDISKYVTPAGDKCNAPCAGDNTQNCGGACVNHIFKVPQVPQAPQGKGRPGGSGFDIVLNLELSGTPSLPFFHTIGLIPSNRTFMFAPSPLLLMLAAPLIDV